MQQGNWMKTHALLDIVLADCTEMPGCLTCSCMHAVVYQTLCRGCRMQEAAIADEDRGACV